MAALAYGRRAETWAALWLRLKGYRILARRHRAPGVGEIDIIARKHSVIVFIEVKARSDLASAAAALSARQRQRLCAGAAGFLAAHPALALLSVRFDAMLLAPGRWPRHVIDAWRADD